jgi:hypothetical protein
MTRIFALAVLLLAGCTGLPHAAREPSPCQLHGEASYACQVKRYNDVAI